jgi:hypothetical protein
VTITLYLILISIVHSQSQGSLFNLSMLTKSNEWLLKCLSNKYYLVNFNVNKHTYIPLPEGVAEVSQIFFRDTHILPKLISYEEHCRRDRW